MIIEHFAQCILFNFHNKPYKLGVKIISIFNTTQP